MINKNIEYETIDIDIDNDGERDSFYGIIYYNDVKYVETMFLDEYCITLTDEDILLFKQINFPMAFTTCIFTKEINNPDYLFVVNGDKVGNTSLEIHFRENIQLTEEIFVYEDIEFQLLNEFIPVDDETNDFLHSLSYEEVEFVEIYVNNEILRMKLKNYPEISYFADSVIHYNGKYYELSRGRYYQLSDNFIKLCKKNDFIFK